MTNSYSAAQPPTSPIDAPFEMRSSFPYMLAVVADAVSKLMASSYEEQFALTRAEWRLVAALADLGPSTATALGAYSTLDKMQISRTLRDMEQKNWVVRAAARADKRAKLVQLTTTGRALYDAVLPLVQDKATALTSQLNPDDYAAFLRCISQLTEILRVQADVNSQI